HITAVEFPWEIAPARRFGSRSICHLLWKCELQLFEEDRPLGEFTSLLVDLVRPWLDVDVVKFREVCLATIESVRRQRGPYVYPLVEVLRQKKLPVGCEFGQVASPGLRIAICERSKEHRCRDRTA